MQFTPGTSLGPYKILSTLGAGGMGEVYRAQHVRLGREVAIKVLPESMADSPDRRNRFEREARVLATLNHPNIATLHGLEDCGDHTLLEMELVPGETLAERIQHGPLSPTDAIPIFKQVAEALEAAHEQGIIHRDLKPANVKVTPEGRVKVLDFGLAKALEFESRSADSPQSPTFTTKTHEGIILGTAAYMSPEQVRGRMLDRRTDIWSFGCMLYEALTGRAPFNADTMSDTLAAVLREEPDWRAMPPAPLALQRLVRRCLKKDPAARLHDIADARLELEEAMNESAALVVPMPGRAGWRISRRHAVIGTVVALAVTAAILLAWRLGRQESGTPAQSRFVVPLPTGFMLEHGPGQSMAISPDGTRLVFVGLERTGGTQLFLRPLDTFEASGIPNTQGASAPFFSPDGRWVGFYAGGALQKVSIDGGSPLKICDAPAVWSGTWGSNGQIVFAAAVAPNGLRRVSADGGTAEELTLPRGEQGELQHAFPQALPGGDRVLFSILTKDGWEPAVLSLASKEWQVLRRGAAGYTPAHFAASGHILYAQANGGLVAVPFDPARGTLTGSAIPLLERIDIGRSGGAPFTVSDTGTLVYLPGRGDLPQRSLVIVDSDGRSKALTSMRAPYRHPRVSRDGSRVTVAIESENGADVWIYDVQRGTRTRLTSGGFNGFPVWNATGTEVTFQSAASPGRFTLFSKDANGGGEQQPLLTDQPAGGLPAGMATLLPGTVPRPGPANPQVPMSWSRDGQHLAFDERKPGAQRDIWVLTRGEDPAPFVLTPFDEWSPAFSPDGQWLAYVSNESGRNEVYVQPYPGPGGKWPISSEGGTEPVWSADGKELFYRRGDELLAVAVQLAPEFSSGATRVLFEGPFDRIEGARDYDVLPAAGPEGPGGRGARFVMVRRDSAEAPQQFFVVSNWFEELKTRGSGR